MYEQNSFDPVARVVQLSEVLEKQRINNAVTHVWQYVPSGIVTQDVLDNVENAKQPLVKIYHYHNNHLGTPQELSDDKGDIVWLSYDRAWGGSFETIYKQQFIDDWSISEAELQPIKFQGQSLDVETGLHYNRFRYYDSDVGMFISRDPIGLLGGSNVFAYAPNPVMWIDPWGLIKAPSSLPNEPGIYIITNETTKQSYVGSAGIKKDGQGMYERVSSLEHTNAQTLLGMKGTKVQYVRVDFGSNPLSDSNRNNILRKYEQREFDKQKARGYTMLNDPNSRIQALDKVKPTDKLIEENGVSAKKRRTTCK